MSDLIESIDSKTIARFLQRSPDAMVGRCVEHPDVQAVFQWIGAEECTDLIIDELSGIGIGRVFSRDAVCSSRKLGGLDYRTVSWIVARFTRPIGKNKQIRKSLERTRSRWREQAHVSTH